MRKAFICPTKYVQGQDELLNLGYFIKVFGDSALLIAHKDDIERVKDKLDSTAKKFGVTFVESNFKGECSREEVARLQELAKENKCACTIGLGGGKAIDTAKCVAQGDNLIIVPTIAATDAPTSHSAVLYTPDGAFDDYAYFKQSPSVVLVDTTVIAKAPTRFLVSGMGDALATYFEARACKRSDASNCVGGKCTLAAMNLAQLCYDTLMENGVQAMIAAKEGICTKAVENVIEANTYLSGIGFESGGLAGAHAIHNGFTAIPETHKMYHGEKVAFGTLVQLVLEDAGEDEIMEVIDFCSEIGLPVTLKGLGIEEVKPEQIMEVARLACAPDDTMGNMPFDVEPEDLYAAIMGADALGRYYTEE